MKILLSGDRGQLGQDCTLVLGDRHEIYGVDIEELDITQRAAVYALVGTFKPDIILNCAAYTQVDLCEQEADTARAVNAKGPENLALAAKRFNSALIHISTDYVFDGRKKIGRAYLETDPPNPISRYGKTKLEGEEAIARITQRYAIVRTAWLYGIGGHNFLKTILRLVLQNPNSALKIVDDQFGSPTWSFRLANQIARLIDADLQGIFHATAKEFCTWYELARYFLMQMEVPHLIRPCPTAEYHTPAQRPQNSYLGNQRFEDAGIDVMKAWQDDIVAFVTQYRERLLREATLRDKQDS